MNEIIIALITSSVTIFGVILANSKTNAVIQNEIKHLTEEVKKHNNFAERIPKIEGKIDLIEERIDVANHRIADLERTNENKD